MEKIQRGNGSKHFKLYEKSSTSKIYTTWARILSDRNIFSTLRRGRITAGSNAPGAFLVFLERAFNVMKFYSGGERRRLMF